MKLGTDYIEFCKRKHILCQVWLLHLTV